MSSVKTRSMKDDENAQNVKGKREYCHISKEKKIQLIQTVLKQKCRIKKIAKDLNINYATAKTILHCYRKKAMSLDIDKKLRLATCGKLSADSKMHVIIKQNDQVVRHFEYFAELKATN